MKLAVFRSGTGHLVQTQATTHLAELYGQRAEVYEALNQPQDALALWKLALDVRSAPKGSGWYE